MTYVGFRIKKRRKELKYSQTTLAALCGWPYPTGKSRICNYESGFRNPSKKNAIDLAKALGVSVNWLLFGDEQVPDKKWGPSPSLCPKEESLEKSKDSLTHQNTKGDFTMLKIDSPHQLGMNAFFIEMRGDSMVSLAHDKCSIYPGDILLINPDLLSQVDDLLLISLIGQNEEKNAEAWDNQAVDLGEDFRIRKLSKDGNELILKPFNSQFKTIPFDDKVVVYGVVTMVQRNVLSPRKNHLKVGIAY